MSWESCVLLLNSGTTGSFFAGDIITGSVVFEFEKKQKIKYMNFEVKGICKAQWWRSSPTVPYVRIYSESKEILNYKIDIFEDLRGRTIEPGVQIFHFHFELPADLPSSFESSIAKVHYFIKIYGKAQCKMINKKVMPFVVLGNINLNGREDFLTPVYIEAQKRFWNADFAMCVKTFKGFAPKQNVPFEIVIVNQKKIKLSNIRVTLVQKLQYNVHSGYANKEKKLCKVNHRRFSNTVTETCRFAMEIPETVPSSIHLTNAMIEISYVFQVQVNFKYHTSLHEEIPVILATVPVMFENFEQFEKLKSGNGTEIN